MLYASIAVFIGKGWVFHDVDGEICKVHTGEVKR
jgi:hypothetical protein